MNFKQMMIGLGMFGVVVGGATLGVEEANAQIRSRKSYKPRYSHYRKPIRRYTPRKPIRRYVPRALNRYRQLTPARGFRQLRPAPRRNVGRPAPQPVRRPAPRVSSGTTGRAPRPAAAPRVGTTFIRGIRYEDHSAGTRLSTASVGISGTFRITSSTLRFQPGQDIRVTLQDVNRGNGFGVTAFRLVSVRVINANTLQVRGPGLALFRNRRFHVAVFVFQRGQSNKTANAGVISFR